MQEFREIFEQEHYVPFEVQLDSIGRRYQRYWNGKQEVVMSGQEFERFNRTLGEFSWLKTKKGELELLQKTTAAASGFDERSRQIILNMDVSQVPAIWTDADI